MLPEGSPNLAAQTGPISGPFVPRPDSREFGHLLMRVKFSGVPMVGVGRRYGPQLPQLRAPADDAPELLALDIDMERVARALLLGATLVPGYRHR